MSYYLDTILQFTKGFHMYSVVWMLTTDLLGSD